MKNVILKISGSCLILSIILYIIYTIRLFSNDYGNSNLQSLFYILINSIPLLILSLYCFGINGTKAGNIIYRTGFCICVVSWLYMQLRNNYIDFNIYAAFNLLFLLIIIYFVIIGFKTSRGLAILGIVTLGIYAILDIVLFINDVYLGLDIDLDLSYTYMAVTVLYNISILFKLAAFILIWWHKCGKYFLKNKSSISNKSSMSIEKELISLKNLYEAEKIAKQEYLKKRADILNKI